MSLEIVRTTDFTVPLRIVHSPGLKDVVFEDSVQSFIPDVVNEYWLAVLVNEKLAGCYRLHKLSAVMWQLHAYMLPKYRKEYSIDATTQVLAWAYSHIDKLSAVVAYAPVCFPNVVAHALKVGFMEVGTLEKAYLRKGECTDMLVLQHFKE